MTIILAVRNVDDTKKSYGTLEVPDTAPICGIYRVNMAYVRCTLTGDTILKKHLLYIEKLLLDDGGEEYAVMSDDRPIEFWRKIPGFKENEE